MFERAPIDPMLIPPLLQKHHPYVKFTADTKKPSFHYYYKKNSRIKVKDLPEVVMDFVKELQGLHKIDIMDKATESTRRSEHEE